MNHESLTTFEDQRFESLFDDNPEQSFEEIAQELFLTVTGAMASGGLNEAGLDFIIENLTRFRDDHDFANRILFGEAQ